MFWMRLEGEQGRNLISNVLFLFFIFFAMCLCIWCIVGYVGKQSDKEMCRYFSFVCGCVFVFLHKVIFSLKFKKPFCYYLYHVVGITLLLRSGSARVIKIHVIVIAQGDVIVSSCIPVCKGLTICWPIRIPFRFGLPLILLFPALFWEES